MDYSNNSSPWLNLLSIDSQKTIISIHQFNTVQTTCRELTLYKTYRFITDLSTFNGFPPESDKYVMKNGNKIPLWSGHNILSYILPDNINLEIPNSSYDNFKDKKPSDSDNKNNLISKYNNQINIVC